MLPLTTRFPLFMFPQGTPPVITSATNVGTAGGSSSVVGTGFVNGCTASVTISGTVTPLSVSFIDSAHLTVALAPGTYAAGTWMLTITNPNGQQDAEPVFVITTVINPMTIFGATLRAQYIAGQAVTSAGKVTSIPDNTGLGNTLTQATSANQPTYNASDPTYNGLPSVNHSAASSQHMTAAALTLGGGGKIYLYAGFKTASSGSNQFLASYDSGVYGMAAIGSTGVPFTGVGTPASWGSSVSGIGSILVGGFDVASGGVTYISIDNETPVTGAQGSVAPSTGRVLDIGALSASSSFYNGSWCEMGILSALPTSGQAIQLQQYMNLTYNIVPPITFTASTNVSPAGGGIRITGGGFLPGATLTGSAGMGAITVTKVTPTLIEATIPAATANQYDVSIINPDGQSLTVANGINVTTTADPMTIFGLLVQGWYENLVTLNGSTVAAWLDKSLLGRDYLQATSANQPVFNASDANFNGHPSLTGNGTTQQMVSNTFNGVSFTAGIVVLNVVRRNSGTGTVFYFNTQQPPWLNFPTTAPQFECQGGTSAVVTWGSAITGTQNIVCVAPSGAGVTSISVANGTPVASTGSTAGQGVTGGFDLFNAAGGSQFNGSIACQVILNGIPTSGQLAAWETYAQGLGAA